MTTNENRETPWHLWVIGVVALLWNAGGAFDYVMTQTRNMEYLSGGAANIGVPVDVMVGYYTSFPAWVDACWAFGVWGAVAGSLLLLLRSRYAFHALVVALLGLIGTTIYTVSSDIPEGLSSPFAWIFTAIIFTVTILLIVYARRMTAKGVLR